MSQQFKSGNQITQPRLKIWYLPSNTYRSWVSNKHLGKGYHSLRAKNADDTDQVVLGFTHEEWQHFEELLAEKLSYHNRTMRWHVLYSEIFCENPNFKR